MGNIISTLFIALAILVFSLIRKNMAAKTAENESNGGKHFNENFPFPSNNNSPTMSNTDDNDVVTRTEYVDSLPSFGSVEEAYDWGDSIALEDQKMSVNGVAPAQISDGKPQLQSTLGRSNNSHLIEPGDITDDTNENHQANGKFHVDLRQAIIYNEILKPKFETM